MSTNTPPPAEPPATPAEETAAPLIPPPPPAEPPTVAAKKRPSPILTGILGLVVGAGVVGGAWMYSSSGTDEPETFTLGGSFVLTESATRTEGEHCEGRDGYDDIADGTSVTVYDAAGGVAATGSIGKSEYSEGGACMFEVTVADVPKGEKFYQVEVSHRGKVQLTAKEAEGGELSTSLG
ncbi:hypothetical protein OHR86_28125 [Streptomyces sp. NBC_00441]|uniref:hypothetical protein n=1 Tax=Streptomyces sp. NBC_00441 TaxID=2975742 RepID=UPI002E2C3263|nr:hypothetical protein [Streptomyces sp. NBC_00441]